jgi:nitroimidazol reductase NimA-like FMN-containing flavoprotein (pyridoxamine 5'-phosphate oxidase superfamily)
LSAGADDSMIGCMEPGDRDFDRERRAELEELTKAECLALLVEHSVGRVAVIASDGLPMVVPVNYVMVADTVVFRSDAGTKLDAAQRHPVAFEIDSIDPVRRTGWSVLVRGVAHHVTPEEVRFASVEPWLGPKRHLVQIVPRHITGRRIRP